MEKAPTAYRIDEPLLCEFAAWSGITTQDELAHLAGVHVNLVSRHWNTPGWLNTIKGESLKALARALPDLARYLGDQPHAAIEEARQRLGIEGVAVSDQVLEDMIFVEGLEPAVIGAALRLADQILRSNSDDELLALPNSIALYWNKQRGRCFEPLLSNDPDRALTTATSELVGRASRLLDLLIDMPPRRGPNQTRDRARQVLLHYVGLGQQERRPLETLKGVDLRTYVTSRLIREDDPDLVDAYQQRLVDDERAYNVEAWMLPAWTGDVDSSFVIPPRKRSLVKTAEELVYELKSEKYGDAYTIYLAETFVPAAIQSDIALGGHRPQVVTALQERREREGTSERLHAAIERVAKAATAA